ncbi:hypothetical protein H4CHR_02973 [Variovorax sp. PBS-H4]|uniref:hypothetical protein n=1 Tax=Variovorax sp. PBS-H4 TaxID=434008 RepID=UPI001315DB39|nr:hypothetical protein [Variovorax sp. PBS-H4]VTU32246.1 hypothetical protein H4CHR_02973 [Variovorax sp. PBS-H4]
MGKELVYVDAAGNQQALDLGLHTYKAAAAAGQTVPQYLATQFPTDAKKHGTAFEQACEQAGIFVKGNKEYGIRPSTMLDVMDPKQEAAAIVKEGVPASRILFPAVILGVIEDKLATDLKTSVAGLERMIAVDDSINGDKFERAVLNFSNPEAARSAPVGQLALPQSMLTITASDVARKIPSWAIGMEISEQALKSTTLDLVGLAVARQAAVESNEKAYGYILSFLNGDSDYGIAALSSISGKVVAASSLDTASSGGTLTQKAWMKWLIRNHGKRTINLVVTDLDGAFAIQNRTGRPVVVGDNGTSARINTNENVVNASWNGDVDIFLTDDVNWPTGTIMGIDTRYGVHRVKSLTAAYSAIEAFALKRSTAMRVDKGELLYRLYDEAFEVLTLT